MIESWHWSGAIDRLTLPKIAETGVIGIVTALHEPPYDEGSDVEANRIPIALIHDTDPGLDGGAAESVPAREDMSGSASSGRLPAGSRQSRAIPAACVIIRICCQFILLIEWARTDPVHQLKRGGTGLRFSLVRMAEFKNRIFGRDRTSISVPGAFRKSSKCRERLLWVFGRRTVFWRLQRDGGPCRSSAGRRGAAAYSGTGRRENPVPDFPLPCLAV